MSARNVSPTTTPDASVAPAVVAGAPDSAVREVDAPATVARNVATPTPDASVAPAVVVAHDSAAPDAHEVDATVDARGIDAPAAVAIAPNPLGSGQMFDRIARRYDLVNRVISLGLDASWRRRTVRSLQLGERPRVLDLATGTGDLAITIAHMCPGATVIGLDPSTEMLAVAERKVSRAALADRISLVVGDAQHLPYADCEMDALTIAFGIRNVPDRTAALREMARVVRPGGRIAILELGEPRGRLLGRIARFHTHSVVPRIGALLSGAREYAYLERSITAFPPREEFAALMTRCGLHVVEVTPLAFGACTLYVATPTEDA